VKPARHLTGDMLTEFERWFADYPPVRRIGKAASLKAYSRARSAGVSATDLLNALRSYGFRSNPACIPSPADWLKCERWDRERPKARPDELNLEGILNPFSGEPRQKRNSDMVDLPALEPWLLRAIENTLEEDPPLLGVPERREIAAIAKSYEEMLERPVDESTLTAWLFPLSVAVQTEPSRGLFDGRVAAILASVPTLPLGVLSRETHAAALRAFRIWPSAGDLIDLLEEHADLLRRRRGALWRLSRPPPAYTAPPLPEPRQIPSEEAREAVAAQMREMVARATPPEVVTRRVKPAHVDWATATSYYLAQAASENPAVRALAELRLAMLAKQAPA
jgi:hypothetical protein